MQGGQGRFGYGFVRNAGRFLFNVSFGAMGMGDVYKKIHFGMYTLSKI